MKLTREQAIKEHRDMWNWISEHVEEIKPRCGTDITDIKEFYLKEIRRIEEEVYDYCFCCEYAYQQLSVCEDKCHTCDHCPLDWGNEENRCIINFGLYGIFIDHIGRERYKEASDVARQIANLPERGDGDE